MPNQSPCKHTLAALALTSLTPIVAIASAPPRFVYVDLGKFEPDTSPITDTAALAINEHGITTGYSFVFQTTIGEDSLFVPHTFRKRIVGELEDLGERPSIDNVYGSHGWSINNLGVVVGDAVFADIPNPDNMFNILAPPVMWIDGEVISLGLLPNGIGGFANAINDRNQVVGGIAFSNGANSAFLWDHDEIKMIPGLHNQLSDAMDINNAGHIVGVSRCTGSTFGHAFLFRDSKLTDLGTLLPDNGGASWARAINERDQILGQSSNLPGAGNIFIWDNGVMHELTADAPVLANMYGLNDFGDVVGQNVNSRAILWRDGVVYNLNDLIRPQNPDIHMSLWQARGINNKGQIAGIAELQDGVFSVSQRAFRLDPVTPDFDSDGVVTIQDLQQLLIVWGSATDPYIDLTGDGVVNSADLANLLANWGNVPVRQPYSWTKNAP